MPFANRRSQWTFESDEVALNTVDSCVRDNGAAVLKLRSNVDRLPFYGRFGGTEDVLDRLRDFRADTVAFY